MQFNHLIRAIKNHDPLAQRQLVDRYSPYLYAICYRYLKQREDAQDALQEALILIFKNIHQVKVEETAFKAWSKRIAINVSLAKFRKAAYQNESCPAELPEPDLVHPKVLEQLKIGDILKLLDQLPTQQRQVFNLFIIDGYSHQEIAEILEIKTSYSRTLLTRARAQMQILIKKKDSCGV